MAYTLDLYSEVILRKYVLMMDKGMGYGDSLCVLSVIQGLHEREECKVGVLSNHPETLQGQPGVDALASTAQFEGFWEEWCKDADKIFRFQYWEENGRMRNLEGGLLNWMRAKVDLPPAEAFPDFVITEREMAFAIEMTRKVRLPIVVFHRGLGRESKLMSLEMCEQVVKVLKRTYTVTPIE